MSSSSIKNDSTVAEELREAPVETVPTGGTTENNDSTEVSGPTVNESTSVVEGSSQASSPNAPITFNFKDIVKEAAMDALNEHLARKARQARIAQERQQLYQDILEMIPEFEEMMKDMKERITAVEKDHQEMDKDLKYIQEGIDARKKDLKLIRERIELEKKARGNNS